MKGEFKTSLIRGDGRTYDSDVEGPWVEPDSKWFAKHPSRSWLVRKPYEGEVEALDSTIDSSQRDILRIMQHRNGGTLPPLFILVVKIADRTSTFGRCRYPMLALPSVKPEDIVDPVVTMPNGSKARPADITKFTALVLLERAVQRLDRSLRRPTRSHARNHPPTKETE